MNCPECDAAEAACESRFHECLGFEFEDPGYGAVHHLTVAAYLLQHSSKLSREGWLHERELLKEFLVENKPPAFIRQQNKDLVDSNKRTFKIKSKGCVSFELKDGLSGKRPQRVGMGLVRFKGQWRRQRSVVRCKGLGFDGLTTFLKRAI